MAEITLSNSGKQSWTVVIPDLCDLCGELGHGQWWRQDMETGPGATTAAKCIRQLSTGKNPPLECRGFYTRHVCRAQIHLRHHHLQKSESASDRVRENKISFFRPLGHSKRLVSNILQRKYKHWMRNIFQQSSLCWWLDINMAGSKSYLVFCLSSVLASYSLSCRTFLQSVLSCICQTWTT